MDTLELSVGYNLPPTKTKKNIFQINNGIKKLRSLLQYKEQHLSKEQSSQPDLRSALISEKLTTNLYRKWLEFYDKLEEHQQKPKEFTLTAHNQQLQQQQQQLHENGNQQLHERHQNMYWHIHQ